MRGVAGSLAASGWFDRVVITYRRTPPEQTLALISAAGVRGDAIAVDFLDHEAKIEATLAEAVDGFGPFDALVHGVGPMVIKRFVRSTLADYHEMFDGNVRSAVLAARAVLPSMRERHFGRLVFFGMHGADQTEPARGLALHLAAKSAVVALARTLAAEEAEHGVTVDAIQPGDIRDKYRTRGQARASGEPNSATWEDIADAVRACVDPRSDLAGGRVVNVTGGWPAAAEPDPR